MSLLHENLTIAGPAGRLEALLWRPERVQQPSLAAVVCHPHPLYGGTMHNKVVYQAAKSLHAFGFPVLRFNFRGVGASAGQYDDGHGEEADASAALDYLRAEFPDLPLLVAGFSFGAWIGLRVGGSDHRVVELIGLGLPIVDPKLDFGYLRACGKPKLILQGEIDQYGGKEQLQAFVATFSKEAAAETRVAFVPGGDHFFTGHLEQMSLALSEWLVERHPGISAAHPDSRT